jgi:quinoprotein glucose dehydrogenase
MLSIMSDMGVVDAWSTGGLAVAPVSFPIYDSRIHRVVTPMRVTPPFYDRGESGATSIMKVDPRPFRTRTLLLCVGLASVASMATAAPASAQVQTGTENGEWRYVGGNAGHTRYSPLEQINAANFADLEVAWIWRGDNFGPNVDYFFRSTPLYVDGVVYTIATPRRQVVAIDPATGETLWVFREPETVRHLRSPRQAYGKGLAYAEVDGRGVIFVITPAFFLWALDAKTGLPLEDWGTPIPLDDFPQNGGVDLIPGLVGDWGRWQDYLGQGNTYDPDHGIPRELGMVSSSSPPIVVNGVVVVGTGHEASYNQTRIENVPGDIQGYDARTGEFLWKFHIIPRPGEFGHETWENDAWQWSGDMSQWALASADPELGLVYMVTNASTVQTYTGQRPGDNLFGGSVIALDVRTGERRWHFQIHHSDQWNYDLPTPPMLMDLTVDGEVIPALVQNTKQGLVFAFNRETGEPIWPIEERPVIQTEVPGNYTAVTQPYPTLPEPLDDIVLNGLTEEFVIDYTPDLDAQAQIILSQFRIGGLYVPPLPYNHDNGFRNNVGCQGAGNVIPHPPVADPTTGTIYANHHRNCSAPAFMQPTDGEAADIPDYASPGAGYSTPTFRCWLLHPHLYSDDGHDRGGVVARRRARAAPRAASEDRGPAALEADGQPAHRHGYEQRPADLVGAGRRDSRGDPEPPSSSGSGRSQYGRHRLFDPDGDGERLGPDQGVQLGAWAVGSRRAVRAPRARQGDRRDPGERRAPGPRPVRDDDLHARGQTVHRGADR